MVRQWSLPNYFASKTKNFAALLFFLADRNEKRSGQMRQISRRMEMIHPTIGWRRDEHRTQNMHTARGFFDLYHVFARKQCILCSAVRHGWLTLLYVTSIWDFFCPWNNCNVLKKSANKLGWNACHCSLVLSSLIYSVIDFIVISSGFRRNFMGISS